MIRPAQEHLRRQVSALLPAQRAGDLNGLEKEFLNPGGYITAAPFAGDHELLSILHHEAHGRATIGEDIARAL
jgi:hypothetical protein